MAIDTAAKRKSCLGLALIVVGTGVIPDASNLSASQRLHVQGLYSGIAAASPVPVPDVITISAVTMAHGSISTVEMRSGSISTVTIVGH